MAANVYKTLAKIVGILLLIVGIGCVWGGNFANGYVTDQLVQQGITMPSQKAVEGQAKSGTSLTQEDVDALVPYADTPLDSGAKAQAYSEHYIAAHMRGAANEAGIPLDQATFQGVGTFTNKKTSDFEAKLAGERPEMTEDEITALAEAEIANPDSQYAEAKEIASLQAMRTDTFFMGSMIRGTLLNAYGWGLVGTIVTIVGWLLIVVGVILALLGFVLGNKKREA